MITTTTTSPSILTADASQADQLIATLVLALGSDPLMRWMCPDPLQYCVRWSELAKTYGGRSFEHGAAHYAAGHVGTALWVPPGIQPDEDALVPLFLQYIAEHKQEQLFAILEGMSSHQPPEPHWHLLLIGVDPAHQNRGVGSALLQHQLARCDRDGTLAYVESSSPRNVPFYERHGFEPVGTIHVDGAPTVWPMVRRPRPL